MALPIKYVAGASAGVAFQTGEARTVAVTAEALDKPSGYMGETVVYTATVKDDLGNALPTTFLVDLDIDTTKVVTGQVLDAAHYDPVTFKLTLSWTVPAVVGTFTVKLVWAEQTI